MSLINEHYNDCYFSSESGYLESKYVFIDGNNLTDKLNSDLFIGETGFGTGLNLLVLEDFLEKQDSFVNVTFNSVEKYPLDLSIVKKTLSQLENVTKLSLERHCKLYESLFLDIKPGWNSIKLVREWGNLQINLYVGDVIDSFILYPNKITCWFLDGHSPDKNPDMWNSKVFGLIALNSIKGTSFATFTAAGIVKQGLRNTGFFVQRKKGYGKKRHMIFGNY
ncbi:MAG: tRNA (5-methylaminomethyl-2-thiouridine)(34)-methyltransferase MnmD [Spirochaetaceae bacterium]